ncbi:uncharacterized protein B0T23DRAFT_369588 [Neurospora hispaniola]|uniref:Uncharacterized protein n=1 Tax=Neurospora hispaniola TaxID=588809 RepID=A0AAJ0MV21_9PEZI|nr:hypothetical protein B0T23DRAFT_369588 [Neurospora hispaniola]
MPQGLASGNHHIQPDCNHTRPRLRKIILPYFSIMPSQARSPLSFQFRILPRTLASCRAVTNPFLPKHNPQDHHNRENWNTSFSVQGPATREARATEPETPGPRIVHHLTILSTPARQKDSKLVCTVYNGFWCDRLHWRSACTSLTLLLLFTVAQSPLTSLAMTNMNMGEVVYCDCVPRSNDLPRREMRPVKGLSHSVLPH